MDCLKFPTSLYIFREIKQHKNKRISKNYAQNKYIDVKEKKNSKMTIHSKNI